MQTPSSQLIARSSPRQPQCLRIIHRALATRGPRRVHWWERIRDFPINVDQVKNDFLRVKDIYAASRTPHNAWTNRYGVMGKIPRRQQEQARQLREDARIVAPMIIMWIPPVIGFLPLFLAIGAPRQVLSRQFLSEYEREIFAKFEMDQRLVHFRDLADRVWASLNLNQHQADMPILGMDKAGPIWDLDVLFEEFRKTNLIHCDALSRAHLKSLALGTGYAQRFPPPLPNYFVDCTPKLWLSHEIKVLGHHIWRDDKLCIEEAYHVSGCEGMTDAEVREACLLRGLPVRVSYAEMRVCMTNHLKMIEGLRESRPNAPRQHLQLLSLHLPALRQQYKKEYVLNETIFVKCEL